MRRLSSMPQSRSGPCCKHGLDALKARRVLWNAAFPMECHARARWLNVLDLRRLPWRHFAGRRVLFQVYCLMCPRRRRNSELCPQMEQGTLVARWDFLLWLSYLLSGVPPTTLADRVCLRFYPCLCFFPQHSFFFFYALSLYPCRTVCSKPREWDSARHRVRVPPTRASVQSQLPSDRKKERE